MLLRSSKLRDVLERRVTLLAWLYDCPEHRTHNGASCMSGLLGAEQKTVLISRYGDYTTKNADENGDGGVAIAVPALHACLTRLVICLALSAAPRNIAI